MIYILIIGGIGWLAGLIIGACLGVVIAGHYMREELNHDTNADS